MRREGAILYFESEQELQRARELLKGKEGLQYGYFIARKGESYIAFNNGRQSSEAEKIIKGEK